MFQLAKRLCLNLPDPLPGDRKLLANFLQRVVSIHTNAEAHPQDAFLARGQAGQNACCCLSQIGMNGGIQRLHRVLIINKITQLAVFLIAYRGLKADRLFGNFQNFAHLIQRHGQLLSQLFRGRLAANLMQHMA